MEVVGVSKCFGVGSEGERRQVYKLDGRGEGCVYLRGCSLVKLYGLGGMSLEEHKSFAFSEVVIYPAEVSFDPMFDENVGDGSRVG